MVSIKWLIKVTFVGLFSTFILTLSLTNLMNAYQLKNPMEFLMTFFSQSLMLMIGIVGIIYTALQIYAYCKKEKPAKDVHYN